MQNRRSFLTNAGAGLGVALVGGGALWSRSGVEAAVEQPQHLHKGVRSDVVAFQRQMRRLISNLTAFNPRSHKTEALRRGAVALELWSAVMESRGVDSLLQDATRRSIKDRGKRATVILEPDYRELEAYVKAGGGDLVPQWTNIYTAPNYALREQEIDGLLNGQGGVVVRFQNAAKRFEEMAALPASGVLTPIDAITPKGFLIRVSMLQGGGQCDQLCSDTEAFKELAEYICALAGFCAAVIPACAPEAAAICASYMATWAAMRSACEMCKWWYGIEIPYF